MADPVKTKLFKRVQHAHILAIQDSVLWEHRSHTHGVGLPGIPTNLVCVLASGLLQGIC